MRNRGSPLGTPLIAVMAMLLVAWPVNVQGTQDSDGTAVSVASTSETAAGPLAAPAHLDVENMTLERALRALQDASGVAVAYSPTLIPGDRVVSCSCTTVSVEEALTTLLRGTTFEFTLLGEQLVIREARTPELPVPTAVATATWTPVPVSEVRRSGDPTPAPEPLREGTISGQVIAAQSQAPLVGVQVSIPGSGLGTLTNQEGRYTLLNVPAGEHTVQADFLGYAGASETVTVASGETVQLDFSLTRQAMDLDEIIVTGTAGDARRREVGNTVEQMNFADFDAPSMSVENALQGRAPGVSITTTSGAIGAGSQIRLRGNVSVAMSSQPLIYIDGVRVFSEAYPSQHGRDFPGGRGAATSTSALHDINPQDIESIEIVKGPAATTLYGTEASAGVIQIITKRGREGATRWTAQVNQGTSWVQPFAPKGIVFGPENRRSEFMYIDPWLNYGYEQRYALSVTGGAGDIGYFLSASMDDNRGVLANEAEERYALRGNLDFSPLDNLHFQWNTAFTNHEMQRVSMGNNAQGLALNAYRLTANYFGDPSKELIDQVLEYDNTEEVGRFITGLTARHTTGNLSNRVTLGYDLANWEGRNVRRFGYILFQRGALGVTRWTHETMSFDYVGSYAFNVSPTLRNTFSWGAQAITDNETEVEGWAEDFPGPGEPTLTSGADTRSWENRMRVINAGLFIQNLFDFHDRYFITLGLRADGNSAFGDDFGMQFYPRASLSYVLSEEDFWPWSASFRLRGAYGHAGRAPGAFDAERTWEPLSWAGQSAFTPRNLGNPDLGPERTQEMELGFESAFLQDRLLVDFTYYHQRTSDALLPVTNIPSEGGWPGQLTNVGEIENRGLELSVDATVYEGMVYGWEIGADISTNHSKVLDLGGAPPFNTSQARIAEGYPVLATWQPRRILNPQERAEPIISTEEEDQFWGPAWPTHTITARTAINLPYGMRLSGRAEYQGGNYIPVNPTSAAVGRGAADIWPICQEAVSLWEQGRDDEVKAVDRMRCSQEHSSGHWNVSPGDFFKLRDVSLAVPVGFAVPGTDDANLTLSVQGVRLWKHSDMEMFDPEMGGGNLGPRSGERRIREQLPPPARFVAQFRVGF